LVGTLYHHSLNTCSQTECKVADLATVINLESGKQRRI